MRLDKLAALAKKAVLIAVACILAFSEFFLIVAVCFPREHLI